MSDSPHRYRNKIVKTFSATPTITAAGAYTAGDALGGLITFAKAADKTFGSGNMISITVIDNDKESAALELHLFNQTFTASADIRSAEKQESVFMIRGAIDMVLQFVDLKVADKEKGFAQLPKGIIGVGTQMFDDGKVLAVNMTQDVSNF